jgi:hypothetical protein
MRMIFACRVHGVARALLLSCTTAARRVRRHCFRPFVRQDNAAGSTSASARITPSAHFLPSAPLLTSNEIVSPTRAVHVIFVDPRFAVRESIPSAKRRNKNAPTSRAFLISMARPEGLRLGLHVPARVRASYRCPKIASMRFLSNPRPLRGSGLLDSFGGASK